MATMAGLIYAGIPVIYVYDKFFQMATSGIVFSFILGCYALIRSRKLKPEEKSDQGNTGKLMYIFYAL